MTELNLLAGCQRQEAAAQRALYERFAGLLFAVCRRYGSDRMQVEDMHQIAFVRIFDQIKSCRAQSRPELEAWLRRVTVNCCLAELARSKRHRLWLNDMPEHQSEPVAEGEPRLGHLDASQLQALIDALPEGARLIFNLFALEGYSHAEIASQLSITENASRSQLSRARQILRERLQTLSDRPIQNSKTV